MDLLEKVFEKYWSPKWKKIRAAPSTEKFADNKSYLETVSAFCLSDQYPLEVVPSRFYIGPSLSQLHLPEYIGVSGSKQLNRKVYLYLTLVSCASFRLGLIDRVSSRSRVAQRLETIFHMPQINRHLRQQFSSYPLLQAEVLGFFKAQLKKNLVSPNIAVEGLWRQMVDDFLLMDMTAEKDSNRKWIESLKSHDIVPDFLFYTVPCLAQQENILTVEAPEVSAQQPPTRKSEKEKTSSERAKKISLEDEKKKGNPVTHSFEKMETADDYQGGYRTDSGDDELNSHENALNEVDLSQMTVDGETAQSVYKTDAQLLYRLGEKKEVSSPVGILSYPEWSEGNSKYLKDYCKLFVSLGEELSTNKGAFRLQLQTDYRSQIDQWRKKISRMTNEPLWQHRQKEGSEIDYDSVIRYLVDIQTKSVSEARFYSQKKKLAHELAVCFLFDQSLSTDSWVRDHRVLDVIVDSLGLAGLLFEDLIANISIAGTWSATRHHCEFVHYKKPEQPWDLYFEIAKQIQPKGYTRLGPAIRHATQLMQKMPERRKVLILLTDGKPTDVDRYEGKHGICDIRKACQEAEKVGIFPFALTIDAEAKMHFPKMFKHFAILPNADQFSEELIRMLMKVLN